MVQCLHFLLACETTKAPVAVAAAEVANTAAVAVTRAREAHLFLAAFADEAEVAIALAEQALALSVAVVGTALGHHARQGSCAVRPAVAGLARTCVTQTDPVLGAAMSRDAALLCGFDYVLLEHNGGGSDTEAL
jgi:hypothetical protein